MWKFDRDAGRRSERLVLMGVSPCCTWAPHGDTKETPIRHLLHAGRPPRCAPATTQAGQKQAGPLGLEAPPPLPQACNLPPDACSEPASRWKRGEGAWLVGLVPPTAVGGRPLHQTILALVDACIARVSLCAGCPSVREAASTLGARLGSTENQPAAASRRRLRQPSCRLPPAARARRPLGAWCNNVGAAGLPFYGSQHPSRSNPTTHLWLDGCRSPRARPAAALHGMPAAEPPIAPQHAHWRRRTHLLELCRPAIALSSVQSPHRAFKCNTGPCPA